MSYICINNRALLKNVECTFGWCFICIDLQSSHRKSSLIFLFQYPHLLLFISPHCYTVIISFCLLTLTHNVSTLLYIILFSSCHVYSCYHVTYSMPAWSHKITFVKFLLILFRMLIISSFKIFNVVLGILKVKTTYNMS